MLKIYKSNQMKYLIEKLCKKLFFIKKKIF